MKMKIVVIGGGAAGFFAAITAKEIRPDATVLILEGSAKLLSKVKVSGGGRCNVTHACFDPKKLIENYPRGQKELLGPFHRFGPQEMVDWFEARGVTLKQEADGRMFPENNRSQTIIDCFLAEAKQLGVEICTQCKVEDLKRQSDHFEIFLRGMESVTADRLIVATGSAPIGYALAKSVGHTIQEPVPSLFTLNIPDFSLVDLAGVSTEATLSIEGSSFVQKGPLLITHWGFSGPAALKLSAFAARELADREYQATLYVDWMSHLTGEQLRTDLEVEKKASPSKQLGSVRFETLSKSLWKGLIRQAGENPERPLRELSRAAILRLCERLKKDPYQMSGKSTHKEEFVTCGGVTLSEVDFRTMESKVCPGLYFCGEVLDIDGVTGGFNFQNAWTTGWLAGSFLE